MLDAGPYYIEQWRIYRIPKVCMTTKCVNYDDCIILSHNDNERIYVYRG